MPERKSSTILGKPVPASPPDTSPLNSSMVILAGQNVEKFNKNDKYRIFLIFLDFIFIDLLEWMVSKCQEKRQERTVSKLAIQNAHHFSFASRCVPFCTFCLKKDQKKNLVSFLVDSIAREHLAFLALTPPEFFTFPGGGVQTPNRFFAVPGGGSWGVLIRGPPPGSKTRPPL